MRASLPRLALCQAACRAGRIPLVHGGSSAPAAGLQPETAPAPAPEREKPARERLLVFVASFLLAVLPVHAALFDPSRVFFGVDSASVQLPWSRALAGPLESPRNPGLADQATFFYPVYRWIARSVEAGDPPLWCPLIYAGVPGLANQQSGVLDPQVGLLVLFHALGGVELFDWGLALVATLRIFLALSGAYFLARRLGLAPSGAALAGITFGFSAFITVSECRSIKLLFAVPLARYSPCHPQREATA